MLIFPALGGAWHPRLGLLPGDSKKGVEEQERVRTGIRKQVEVRKILKKKIQYLMNPYMK